MCKLISFPLPASKLYDHDERSDEVSDVRFGMRALLRLLGNLSVQKQAAVCPSVQRLYCISAILAKRSNDSGEHECRRGVLFQQYWTDQKLSTMHSGDSAVSRDVEVDQWMLHTDYNSSRFSRSNCLAGTPYVSGGGMIDAARTACMHDD